MANDGGRRRPTQRYSTLLLRGKCFVDTPQRGRSNDAIHAINMAMPNAMVIFSSTPPPPPRFAILDFDLEVRENSMSDPS
jgi:hypothetical protein